MSALPKTIQQPGPTGAPYSIAKTSVVAFDFELPNGASLHDGLDAELQNRGLVGGYARIIDTPMRGVSYFIPGLSPDDTHVAWYSETHIAPMPGSIADAGINCGALKDGPFYHCHGITLGPDGNAAMGHLLPETCILSGPARLSGFGFKEARFNRVSDAQTGFDLFVAQQVTPAPSEPEAILLRIAPNIPLEDPLFEACKNAGWSQAEVFGVGSIIGAHFADGRVMESFATEFFVTKGRIDLSGPTPLAEIEIAIVGLDGSHMQGLLAQGENPVLITAEMILKKLQ